MGHVSRKTARIRSYKPGISAPRFACAKYNPAYDLEPPLSDKFKRQRTDVSEQAKTFLEMYLTRSRNLKEFAPVVKNLFFWLCNI